MHKYLSFAIACSFCLLSPVSAFAQSDADPEVPISFSTPMPESPAPEASPTPTETSVEEDLCQILGGCGSDFPFDMNLLFYTNYRVQSLASLNQIMESKGYSAFSNNNLSFGGAFQFEVWNVLTEFEANFGGSSPVANKDFWVNMNTGNMFLNLGYQFKPFKWLNIYPIAGLGISSLDMDFRSRNLFPSFDELISSPGRQSRVSNIAFATNVGLGIDWETDWGGQIGIRGGYVWGPPSNWWSVSNFAVDTDDDNSNSVPITGGPNIDLSGPYVRVMLGF